MCSITSSARAPMSRSPAVVAAWIAARPLWMGRCWRRIGRSISARAWSTDKSSREKTSASSRARACVAHPARKLKNFSFTPPVRSGPQAPALTLRPGAFRDGTTIALARRAVLVVHKTVSHVRRAQDRLEACPTGIGVAWCLLATTWIRPRLHRPHERLPYENFEDHTWTGHRRWIRAVRRRDGNGPRARLGLRTQGNPHRHQSNHRPALLLRDQRVARPGR